MGKSKKSKKREDTQEILENIISSACNNALTETNWSNLDVSVAEGRIGKIEGRGSYGTRYFSEVRDRVKQLNLMTEDLKRGIGDVDRINQIPGLEKKLEMVKNLYQNNYAELRRIISSSLGKIPSKEEKNMIENLNYLIENYVPLVDIAEAKQDLFKGIMDIIFVKGNEIGEDKFFEAIGSNKSNPEFFIKGMVRKGKINTDREDTFGDLTRTVRTSGQNTNIQFKYNRKVTEAIIKDVDLSPAAQKRNAEITLVQGESLLNYLQDEDANFVNHYFNLFTTHEGRGNWSADKNAVLETVKLISLYKAITGDSYKKSGKRNIPELFIVNNSSAKAGNAHVKIYNIYDILKKATRYIDSYAFFKGTTFNNNFLFRNDKVKGGKWARTGIPRIIKVLTQAHQAKIAVGINSRILSKL